MYSHRNFFQNMKPAVPCKFKSEKDNNRINHTTIFKCPKCRRPWQNVTSDKGHIEYFPNWIAGDKDKICPECKSSE